MVHGVERAEQHPRRSLGVGGSTRESERLPRWAAAVRGSLLDDRVLYGVSMVFAVGVVMVSTLPAHRLWALFAAPSYAAAAGASCVLAVLARRRPDVRRRWRLIRIGVGGAVLIGGPR